MLKLLVWLAGSCGLLWVAWRFATWHLLLQLVVLAALFLWVAGGGVVIAYRVKHTRAVREVTATERAALTPEQARANYVACHGETQARSAELASPAVWDVIAHASRAQK